MRVLSQWGTNDIPYEKVGICINAHDDKEIIAYPINGNSPDDEYWPMARYTDCKKAIKAMEMLRIAYAGRFVTNADIPDDFNEQLKELMKVGFGAVIVKDFEDCKVEFNNLSGYFQFPQDSEIEV